MQGRALYRKFCTVLIGLMCVGYGYQYRIVHLAEQRGFDIKHFHYFAITVDGRMEPMRALNQASLTDAALLTWAENAVLQTLDFNHKNYHERLKASSSNYTRNGWESFTTWLERSTQLDAVQSNKTHYIARLHGHAELLKTDLQSGRLIYEVVVPITMNRLGGARQMDVHLTIVRTPKLEQPSGVGIERWSFSQGLLYDR
tara:strand:+ start:171057 stop:171656 length:600 start_codon:yes stop_codon:yes gene_type:complete